MTPPLSTAQRLQRLEQNYTQLAEAYLELQEDHERLVKWVEQLAHTRRDDGLRRSPQETGEPLPIIELVDPPRGRM